MLFNIIGGFKYGWKRWWLWYWWVEVDFPVDVWLCLKCSTSSSAEENLALHEYQWQLYGWLLAEAARICRTVSHCKQPGTVHGVENECCCCCWAAK